MEDKKTTETMEMQERMEEVKMISVEDQLKMIENGIEKINALEKNGIPSFLQAIEIFTETMRQMKGPATTAVQFKLKDLVAAICEHEPSPLRGFRHAGMVVAYLGYPHFTLESVKNALDNNFKF